MNEPLSPDEMRRVIGLALAISKNEGRRTPTLADLKRSAEDFGIAPEHIDAAYAIMQRQRRTRAAFVIVLLIAASAAGLFAFKHRPVHYKGDAALTFTSAVDQYNEPSDSVLALNLFASREIIAFVRLNGLTYPHLMHCTVTDSHGTKILEQSTQIERFGSSNYNVWFRLLLPWETPTDHYTVRVYADADLIAQRPLDITIGTVDLAAGTEIKNADLTVRKSTFRIGTDETIYILAQFDNLRGAASVSYEWHAPNGSVFATHTHELTGTGIYNVWDHAPVATLVPGEWHVRARVATHDIGEIMFTVQR